MKAFLILIFIIFFTSEVKAQPGIDAAGNKNENIDVYGRPLPSFPSGVNAWYKFLNKHLTWPKDDAGETSGTVVISFTVEKNGNLTNYKVIKGMGEAFDKEAMRVVKLSPKWIPAKQNGQAIKSVYTFPIRFTIGK
jgi:periplasmic protein TonB